MKAYPRILAYCRPYKIYLILSVLCHLLFAFFSLFTFGLIVPFASILFGLTDPVTVKPDFSLNVDVLIDYLSYYITLIQENHGMSRALLFVSTLFLSSAFLSNLFRFLGSYFLNPINLNVARDLRNEMYEKTLVLPLSFYTSHRSGDMITRLNADIQEVNNVIKNSILLFTREPFQILIFSITLLFISPLLTLTACIAFPLAIFFTSKIGNSIRRNAQKAQNQLSMINTAYEEGISGMRIIKGYNSQSYFMEKFHKMGLKFNKVTNKALRRIELSGSVAEMLAITALCIVIFTGAFLVFNENSNLNTQTLILFVIIFARLISPIQTAIKNINFIEKSMVSVRRVFEVIDAEEVIEEKKNALPLKSLENQIECKNISFGYEEGKEVLEDFNLTIPKGKMIAIVGASGSGKSTLANLLLRFYDVKKGTIFIDGTDIRDYVISDVRNLIGLVSQEIVLFHDTIYNNISFGKEFSKEEVMEAARIANADQFIQALPEGYESIIGDRGLTLSGGQRQRLSIARALLRNPQVLVLDEATASLDSQSERLVQEALDRLLVNRTALVIAHRLSTIQKADEIIVLDKGHIAERGNHSELYALKGLYYGWVKLQEM